MYCSFCGLPLVPDRWHLCAGASASHSGSLFPAPFNVSSWVPLGVEAATRGESAPCTFTQVAARASADQALFADWQRRQEQDAAFLAGTATVMTCDLCHEERDAHHVLTTAQGMGMGSALYFCGPCLDGFAEALYLACAKRGVPHWRKKQR